MELFEFAIACIICTVCLVLAILISLDHMTDVTVRVSVVAKKNGDRAFFV